MENIKRSVLDNFDDQNRFVFLDENFLKPGTKSTGKYAHFFMNLSARDRAMFDMCYKGQRYNIELTLESSNIDYNKYELKNLNGRLRYIVHGPEEKLKDISANLCELIELSFQKIYDIAIGELLYHEIDYDNLGTSFIPSVEYKEELAMALYFFQKSYGYTGVYYQMFKDALSKILDGNDDKVNIHIVSFGCGLKTDALAFKYAMDDYFDRIENTQYIGIDPGSWNESEFFIWLNENDTYHKPDGSLTGNIIDDEKIILASLKKEIVGFANKDGRNVFFVVFPNSLSEMYDRPIVGSKNWTKFEELTKEIKDVYNGKEYYLITSRNPTTIDNGAIEKIDKAGFKSIVTVEPDTILGSTLVKTFRDTDYIDRVVEGYRKNKVSNNKGSNKGGFSDLDNLDKDYTTYIDEKVKDKSVTSLADISSYHLQYIAGAELNGLESSEQDYVKDKLEIKEKKAEDEINRGTHDVKLSYLKKPIKRAKYLRYEIYQMPSNT